METVGRVLWLWYPAFSLPLFPKTLLSRKSTWLLWLPTTLLVF